MFSRVLIPRSAFADSFVFTPPRLSAPTYNLPPLRSSLLPRGTVFLLGGLIWANQCVCPYGYAVSISSVATRQFLLTKRSSYYFMTPRLVKKGCRKATGKIGFACSGICPGWTHRSRPYNKCTVCFVN